MVPNLRKGKSALRSAPNAVPVPSIDGTANVSDDVHDVEMADPDLVDYETENKNDRAGDTSETEAMDKDHELQPALEVEYGRYMRSYNKETVAEESEALRQDPAADMTTQAERITLLEEHINEDGPSGSSVDRNNTSADTTPNLNVSGAPSTETTTAATGNNGTAQWQKFSRNHGGSGANVPRQRQPRPSVDRA